MNVYMFHSVGVNHTDWELNYLSVPLLHFERFCEYLKNNKYNTFFFEEWTKTKYHNEKNKNVVLTFDDGYLDNWIFVYPILKKYDLKATIFINPEFVDESKNLRTFEDLYGNCLGFCNWDEIKFMQNSGVIDIQSHSMSHNWYFTSEKIVDIYAQSDYFWLHWLLFPSQKCKYAIEDQYKEIKAGFPIFDYGRSLGVRRYFPDQELIDYSIKAFNQESFDKNELIDRILEFGLRRKGLGRYETDSEMLSRYEYELYESKRIIEDKLGKPVDYLCWPGGAYNDLSLKISKKVGYKASTLSSREKNIRKNCLPQDRIPRVSIAPVINLNKRIIVNPNLNSLIHEFREMEGEKCFKYFRWIRKAWMILND